jgi:tRNA-binding EMAP/Myf-like protein
MYLDVSEVREIPNPSKLSSENCTVDCRKINPPRQVVLHLNAVRTTLWLHFVSVVHSIDM